jgi:glycosyltransferase involved in cell wall biosynthesis
VTADGDPPSRLRIGIVAWRELAHPQAGGSEVLVDRVARVWARAGHDVALMCGGPVAPRPYAVLDLGGEFAQYLRAPLVRAQRLRDRDVILDVENGIPFFAPLWCRTPVVCLVHHVHDAQWALRFRPPVSTVGRGLERWGMPLAYRRAPFVAVSPSTAASLRRLGVPPQRIHVVANGVDARLGPGAVREAPEPLFLALGRLVPHKRIDLLLALWPRVRAVTGGRLVIAGDGPERPRLERLVSPGVELRGAVSEEEKERLLAEAWLLVHPALHEGWGIVAMEAAAMGTPTLAFDVPGVRDAVRHGVTGELAADEDALVRAWIALTADAPRRRRLGEAARRRAADFSWDRSAARLLDVLRGAAAQRPRAPATRPVGQAAS